MRRLNDRRRIKSKDILSGLDLMTLAKRLPGCFDAPYVAAMNMAPLATLKSTTGFGLFEALTYDTAGYANGTLHPLGTSNYTVIMNCSALTAFTNTGAYSTLSPTDKNSGISLWQSSSTSTLFSAHDLFRVGGAIPMATAFGSDLESFSEKGFSWAQHSEYEVVAPEANVAGKIWKGRILYGQLFDASRRTGGINYSDGGGLYLTLQQLINLAQEVKWSPQNSVSLQTSIVNNNLPYLREDAHTGLADQKDFAEYLNQPAFGGEIIEYCIIQNAAMNITTGANMPFTMVNDVSQNLAFWPRASDAVMNNLFRVQQNTKTYTKMAAESKLDDVEARIGTTNIVSTDPVAHREARALGNRQNESGDWLSEIWNFVKRHKNNLLDGLDFAAPWIPGGSIISTGARTLFKKDEKVIIYYIGSLRKILQTNRPLPKTGLQVVDEVSNEINSLCSKLLVSIEKMPDYYEPDANKIPDRAKSSESQRRRLEELSQIGMKTESETSEFMDVAKKLLSRAQ